MPSQTESDLRSWSAPAKLNLFLHITGRRPDGYHDLQTLFQILDWGDKLRFSINNSGYISRSCNIDGIEESDDICVRAAQLLKTRCEVQQGVHIDLIKRIPMGAGLGGGSSDAATVLLVLNKLWSCGLSRQQLAELGLDLGADVPVFVHGHSALAEGRGEKLQAVTLGQRFYVLVFPEISISTADVFHHPQLRRDSKPMDMSVASLKAGRNDCETAALDMYPELTKIMQDLRTKRRAHMSGTGSTIFLPFDDKKTAISAASELKCRYNVRAVGGVDRSHVLDNLSAA
jgi:4-diphosphocytidyl-2-C-methyl-D-erythritol kinase